VLYSRFAPGTGLVCLIAWAATAVFWKYSSLSALIAFTLYPIVTFAVHGIEAAGIPFALCVRNDLLSPSGEHQTPDRRDRIEDRTETIGMDQPDADRAGQGDRSRVREHLSTWQPTAVSIVLIMVMRPSPKLPHIRHVDKYLHTLASAFLPSCLAGSFVKTGVRSGALSTFLLGLVVGMSYEGGQALDRVRTADRYDHVADEIGTIIGMLIFALS